MNIIYFRFTKNPARRQSFKKKYAMLWLPNKPISIY